jgi:TPR repeat protein
MSVPNTEEESLRHAAEAGDNEAAFRLGLLLMRQGESTEAESWFRKAAEAGDVEATNNVGLILMRRGDAEEAEPWLRRAAEAGSVEAARNLRLLHAQDQTGIQRWINTSIFFDTTGLRWGGCGAFALGIIFTFGGSWLAGLVFMAWAAGSLFVTRFGKRWVELSAPEKLLAGPIAVLGYLTIKVFLFAFELIGRVFRSAR